MPVVTRLVALRDDLFPTEDESISRSITPVFRMLLGTVAVVLTFILAPAPALAEELPPGGTFLDDDQSVHEGAIEAIADEGITSGCGGDRYCPRAPVSRGQMAAFLVRALGLPASDVDHFDDDDGHLFEADINALAEAGITRGCGDGTGYCPDGNVTRGEMAAFLVRADRLEPTDVDHFRDDDGHLFEAEINALADAGVTSGCNPPDNSRFCPGDVTLRGQMASFLTRFLGLEPIAPPERDGRDVSVRDSIRTWFPDQYERAVRIADCESSLNPRAVNHAGGWHGLFQISERYHRSAFERVTGVSWEDGIYVAYYNAQYARDLQQRQGWGPWGCRNA